MKTSIIMAALMAIPASIAHAQGHATTVYFHPMAQNVVTGPQFHLTPGVLICIGIAMVAMAGGRLYRLARIPANDPLRETKKQKTLTFAFAGALLAAGALVYAIATH
jgi:hypothetical protein